MSKDATGGISFCGLLTIVFITLKLTSTIDWHWFWSTIRNVLFPLSVCMFILLLILKMIVLLN